MSDAATHDSRRALSGLLEVTADVPAGAEGLEVLLGALSRALAVECAVLEVVDESTGGVSVVTTAGAPLFGGSSGLAAAVMAAGAPIEVDAGADALLPESFIQAGYAYGYGLPLAAQGRPVAVVWVAGSQPPAAHPECRHAARAAAERIGWIVERGRLYASLERAMAQILQSDERMLGRIGLDIHDGPTQHLSVALLEVQLLEAELNDAEASGATLPTVLRPALGRIYETLGGALHEMRELIGHLRPAQFESRRLDEILRDAMVAHESRTGNPVEPDVRGEFADADVSLTQKITFYRILQEALNNAHRHGQARNVRVSLVQDPAGIQMEVIDDGGGFDPDAAQRPRPGVPQARYGLVGMRDRTQLLGGTFEVESAAGRGTVLRVYLPKWTPQDASVSGVVRV